MNANRFILDIWQNHIIKTVDQSAQVVPHGRNQFKAKTAPLPFHVMSNGKNLCEILFPFGIVTINKSVKCRRKFLEISTVAPRL